MSLNNTSNYSISLTGMTVGNLTATSISSELLSATNISAGTLSGTTITGANLSLSGNLTIAGTLTTVNITSTNVLNTNVSAGTIASTNATTTNIVGTNVSAGTVRVIDNLISIGNSNTVGNIFTTGGNVGIGTGSPGYKLDVRSTTGNLAYFTNSLGSAELGVGQSTSPNNIGLLNFNYSGAGSGNNSLGLGFYSGNNKLVVKADGNVGIGTTSPGSTLQIHTTNASSLGVSSTGATLNLSYLGGGSPGQIGATLSFSQYWWDANPANPALINTGAIRGIKNSASGDFGGGLQFLTVPNASSNMAVSMTLINNGNIGIGTVSPGYPLTVIGSVNSGNVASYSGYFGQYGFGDRTSVYSTSIYASHFILAGQGFASLSDNRIKKDIVDLDDNEALISLRAIQPKKYKYKDYYSRGDREVYGFIAQQIEEVMPYATGSRTDYIPNILKKCNLQVNENNVCVITMKDNESHGIATNFNGKIKLFTETEEKIITVKEVINDYTLTINETLPEREYFMYGIEVDDFKILNKEAIFTTSVAAIQQLDRELQQEKTLTQQQATTIQNLETMVVSLEARLTAAGL